MYQTYHCRSIQININYINILISASGSPEFKKLCTKNHLKTIYLHTRWLGKQIFYTKTAIIMFLCIFTTFELG